MTSSSAKLIDKTNSLLSASFDKEAAATVKCLFFDVFGTCVDWRGSITHVMYDAAQASLSSPKMSLSVGIREKASAMTYQDWGDLAQEWRNSYLAFTKGVAGDLSIPYKTVDQHHLDSLRELLLKYGLILPRPAGDTTPLEKVNDGSLWPGEDIVNLSLKWHHLAPWPDSQQGIRELNKKYRTFTLSNGNLSLLDDLVAFGDLHFTGIYSAELFGSYKPNSKVYLGAAERAGVRPEECMMVAAHLDDLKFARANGLRTMYVERPQEERHPELLEEEGLVDVWVGMDEYGFVAAAEKLGIEVERKPLAASEAAEKSGSDESMVSGNTTESADSAFRRALPPALS